MQWWWRRALILVGLLVAGCASGSSTALPPTSSIAATTTSTTAAAPAPAPAEPSPSSTTDSPPPTTTEPDLDPRPEVDPIGDDVERIFAELFDLGQWRLRNPDRVPEPERPQLLTELLHRGERLLHSSATVEDVEVWDTPTADRVIVIANIDRPEPEVFVATDGSVVGVHATPDPTSSPLFAVMTRPSATEPWSIVGASPLLTREQVGGELEDGHFVGLAIDSEVTRKGPITIIDRAGLGASGSYHNDGRNGCFYYDLPELGRYPICLFADEVHVPSNTFGAVFVPVHGTDVLLALGWAGRAPRWRYWTMEGDVHELFYSVRYSAGRAFVFGTFTGQPRSFRVGGVEVPVTREVSSGALLFERARPPDDALAAQADGASSRLWREPGGVTCLQSTYAGLTSERVCNRELLDGSASPAVGYALTAGLSGPTAGPIALAVSVPQEIVALELTLDGSREPLRLEPMADDGRRWLATSLLQADVEITTMTAIDAEGRRRELDLPYRAHYEGAGLAYLPR